MEKRNWIYWVLGGILLIVFLIFIFSIGNDGGSSQAIQNQMSGGGCGI